MRPHFGALFWTWLVGSLTAGAISTIDGNVENLVGDGSPLGILDATAGWLLFTAPVSAIVTGFFFLPAATLLEWRRFKSLAAYIAAGLVAVTVFIALFFGIAAMAHGLMMMALPAITGGATWWFFAIRLNRDEEQSVRV